MASTTNPLILTDNSGREDEIFDPQANIMDGHYNHAVMDNKKSPNSFYMVYDKINYGVSGEPTKTTLVPSDPLSGASGPKIDLTYPVASAQGFDILSPGICLFAHPNFYGNARQFQNSEKDLTDSFPNTPDGKGVSSIIVTGGKWRLWGARNFKEPKIKDLEKGCYPSEGYDRVQSIERLQS